MLHAFDDGEIEFWQINKRVSNPRNNDGNLADKLLAITQPIVIEQIQLPI